MPNSFFHHRTYSALDENDREKSAHLYEWLISESLSPEDNVSLQQLTSTQNIGEYRQPLETLVKQYDRRLTELSITTKLLGTGHTLDDARKAAYQDELNRMLQVFIIQYKISAIKGLSDANERAKQLEACLAIRMSLDQDDLVTPEAIHQELLNYNTNSPMRFAGLMTIAPMLRESINTVGTGMTEGTVSVLSTLNEWRLFWMWEGDVGFLGSIIMFLPDDFAHAQQASRAVKFPSPFTGFLSWALYYLRFALRFGLLLRYSVDWLMSDDEKAMNDASAMWHEQKFGLLNDLLWGTVNLLCVIWLIGKLMYFGDVLNGIFFGMDLVISLWDWWEQYNKHRQDDIRLCEDIQALEGRRRTPKEELELRTLRRIKKYADIEWRYTNYSLFHEALYSLNLCLSFLVMCSFFIPSAGIVFGASSLILYVIGAAACVFFTILNEAVQGVINKEKSQALNTLRNEEIELLKNELSTLNRESPDDHGYEKRYLYLEIMRLESDVAAEQVEANNQATLMWYTVAAKTLIPSAMFASLLFFPLHAALAAICAVAIIAAAIYMLLPLTNEEVIEVSFDEIVYDDYLQNLPAP